RLRASLRASAMYVFFFQAEDGIRDWSVTGVQTCALPILALLRVERLAVRPRGRVLADAAQSGLPVEDGVGRAHVRRQRRRGRLGIGRASCRGRGEIEGGGGALGKRVRRERG